MGSYWIVSVMLFFNFVTWPLIFFLKPLWNKRMRQGWCVFVGELAGLLIAALVFAWSDIVEHSAVFGALTGTALFGDYQAIKYVHKTFAEQILGREFSFEVQEFGNSYVKGNLIGVNRDMPFEAVCFAGPDFLKRMKVGAVINKVRVETLKPELTVCVVKPRVIINP